MPYHIAFVVLGILAALAIVSRSDHPRLRGVVLKSLVTIGVISVFLVLVFNWLIDSNASDTTAMITITVALVISVLAAWICLSRL